MHYKENHTKHHYQKCQLFTNKKPKLLVNASEKWRIWKKMSWLIVVEVTKYFTTNLHPQWNTLWSTRVLALQTLNWISIRGQCQREWFQWRRTLRKDHQSDGVRSERAENHENTLYPPCKMMIPKLRSQHTLAGICKACYALYATAWTMTFKSPIFQQGFKTIDDGFSLTGFLLPWGHKQKSNQFKYLSTCGSMWASMHSVCGGMPWGWNLVCDRSL